MLNDDWIEIPCLVAEQPLGTLLVGVMDGKLLAQLARVDIHRLEERPRSDKDQFWAYVGIQRQLNSERVSEIASYAEGSDAVFPTSILVAVDHEHAEWDGSVLRLRNEPETVRILDGQHRLAGLAVATDNKPFHLPITFLVEPSWEVQAHVFTSVNATQKPINPSLARNLLQFAKVSTPEKVLHHVAKSMNSDSDGPWFDLIKMIGYREKGSRAMLTQHAFIEGLVDLIYSTKKRSEVRTRLSKSRNNRQSLAKLMPKSPQRPLRDLYLEDQDHVIRTILDSYFRAMASEFSEEWGNPHFVLTKTTGFNAMVEYLRECAWEGIQNGTVSRSFFEAKARAAALNVQHKGLPLTSHAYGVGKIGSSKLALAFQHGDVEKTDS